MSSAFGRALKFLPVAAVLMVAGALLFNVSASSKPSKHHAKRPTVPRVDAKLYKQGKHVFRYDTFGDEAYWSGQLQLDKAIEGAKNGGVGPGVSPKTALAVGLKVDANALPKAVVNGIKKGKVNLNDPKTTLALLKLNAVVGVQGKFNRNGSLRSIGLTCAVCHSTVNNSFAPG